jgi:hypothetical protein
VPAGYKYEQNYYNVKDEEGKYNIVKVWERSGYNEIQEGKEIEQLKCFKSVCIAL